MTRQQELELLAEWLGIERWYWENGVMIAGDALNEKPWNPITDDTDFLNMVAGRVRIWGWFDDHVEASPVISEWDEIEFSPVVIAYFTDHNNDKLAAMKHAAYQVCLMAAREWKSGQ